jgi:hypothetical protein
MQGMPEYDARSTIMKQNCRDLGRNVLAKLEWGQRKLPLKKAVVLL